MGRTRPRRHHHDERAQRVLDRHRAGVVREEVGNLRGPRGRTRKAVTAIFTDANARSDFHQFSITTNF
jgi:hypothetical protein